MEVGSPLLVGGTTLRIIVTDPSQVGQARRTAQRQAELHGFDAIAVGRAGIVATELANNLLKHGAGGELLLQPQGADTQGAADIEIIAIDKGPGIPNVERALRDGFSTVGTPGTGLGAVRRLSRLFDMYSVEGAGTAVLARVARGTDKVKAAEAPPPVQVGAVCRALSGESECGDSWKLAWAGDKVALMVVDGLGHGALAARAATAAVRVFGSAPLDSPIDTVQKIHIALGGGRGAAAACALVGLDAAKIQYCGVGNVNGRLATPETSRGMVSHNGTLGVQLLRKQQFEYDWPARGLMIMHSDGVSARWALADYPGLCNRHPALIAAIVYRDHARERDDATIVVVGRAA